MVKAFLALCVLTTSLVIIALTHRGDLNDFERALEDKEQAEYLKEWAAGRRNHGNEQL